MRSRIVYVAHGLEIQILIGIPKEYNCMIWAICKRTGNGGATDKLVNT